MFEDLKVCIVLPVGIPTTGHMSDTYSGTKILRDRVVSEMA